MTTYVSIDIETDGPVPGLHSMLSLGAVAYTLDGDELGSFAVNLLPLNGATQHPDTMKWWEGQPEAWAEVIRGQEAAAYAMRVFADFVSQYKHPTAVCYPASFDWTFVHWYFVRFYGANPFGFSGVLDLKSMAATLLGLPLRKVTKRTMPKEWLRKSERMHVAVDDARAQGYMHRQMEAAARTQLRRPYG